MNSSLIDCLIEYTLDIRIRWYDKYGAVIMWESPQGILYLACIMGKHTHGVETREIDIFSVRFEICLIHFFEERP